VSRDPFGLYIHIPFCTAKCGYCDFNSYAGHDHLIPSYSQTLLTEASLWERTLAGREVTSVFFGGGTPSLNPVEEMRAILEGLRRTFRIAPDAETTLEANPGSLTEEYLRGLRVIGFNRISIGVQSFDDEELKSLDRIHSAQDASDGFAAARAAGFADINLDLIYGLPDQPLSRWQANLEQAIALGPEHLSLYGLTIEDGTPLARDIARGRKQAPDADAQAEQYEWTQERMARAGYDHYEISNWARPGHACRHNLVYWQHHEYLGLGAGAHSFVNGARFSSVLLPNRYIELVEDSAAMEGARQMRHLVGVEPVTPELARSDALILGLRLIDGVRLTDYRERFGVDAYDAFGPPLRECEGYGLLERDATHLRLTARGRLLSNEVFERLLPAVAV
jgi:oxygen-independent coproporphyrinogen-3 oxidase